VTARKEFVAALQAGFRSSGSERIKILDEFGALTGYHRKHVVWLLRAKPSAREATGEHNRLYDQALRQALIVLWEAADRICGKRLKALIPMLVDTMERHGHLDLGSSGHLKADAIHRPATAARWTGTALPN
jgi:hypothetical protein